MNNCLSFKFYNYFSIKFNQLLSRFIRNILAREPYGNDFKFLQLVFELYIVFLINKAC